LIYWLYSSSSSTYMSDPISSTLFAAGTSATVRISLIKYRWEQSKFRVASKCLTTLINPPNSTWTKFHICPMTFISVLVSSKFIKSYPIDSSKCQIYSKPSWPLLDPSWDSTKRLVNNDSGKHINQLFSSCDGSLRSPRYPNSTHPQLHAVIQILLIF
jgi:hypothetical protein